MKTKYNTKRDKIDKSINLFKKEIKNDFADILIKYDITFRVGYRDDNFTNNKVSINLTFPETTLPRVVYVAVYKSNDTKFFDWKFCDETIEDFFERVKNYLNS